MLIGIAVGCGGGGGSNPPGGTRVNNVQPISVNLGVTQDYADGVFTSVTVCAPGSNSACQTIPHVLVDTGSYGLRLVASAVTVPLPGLTTSDGSPLAECALYAASFNWGPVVSGDVKLAGETAASLPIQLLAPAGFPAPPSACGAGFPESDTQQDLGANGILGIGVFRHDCGATCSTPSTTIPAAYFSCPNSGCTATLVPIEDQVQNPVWLFAQDNNGVVVSLPSVPAQGALTATGTLTFGIATQADNQLGNATVLLADGRGNVQTTFQGTPYDNTVFDSGSNGIFFLNSTLLPNLPVCADIPGFYCPSSTQSFTATNAGAADRNASATTVEAQWDVANADELLYNNPSFAAFNNLGGPFGNSSPGFDFGLPFFFGRSIYVGINQTSASAGSSSYQGPFYGY